jgi:hypothetical protein
VFHGEQRGSCVGISAISHFFSATVSEQCGTYPLEQRVRVFLFYTYVKYGSAREFPADKQFTIRQINLEQRDF